MQKVLKGTPRAGCWAFRGSLGSAQVEALLSGNLGTFGSRLTHGGNMYALGHTIPASAIEFKVNAEACM